MPDRTPIRGLIFTVAVVASVALSSMTAAAGDWPHWRGPDYNGSIDETGLPVEWSQTKNVAWSVPMPGTSSSTPIVWGERVFLASNDEAKNSLFGMCIHRDTGEVIWQKRLAETTRNYGRNDMASASPVTDGKLVYFIFGTSDLIALDFDGDEVWSRHLDSEFGLIGQQFGYSSSPLLYDGRLYLAILRGQWENRRAFNDFSDKDSHLLCLDPATGKTLWRVHRPSDAVGESFDSYSSPIPYEYGGVKAIIVTGGDLVTSHDAESGKELWRYANNPSKRSNWRLIPSPVVIGDLVCGVQPRGLDVFAIKPGEKTKMAYTDAHWLYKERTADVPCPVYYQGRLYVLNGVRKVLTCLDPATGKEIWRGDLGGNGRMWASPTAADGKIYCITEEGEVVVVAVGDDFKVLSRIAMGGRPVKSTVAIAAGKLFIRTTEKLYCIGAS